MYCHDDDTKAQTETKTKPKPKQTKNTNKQSTKTTTKQDKKPTTPAKRNLTDTRSCVKWLINARGDNFVSSQLVWQNSKQTKNNKTARLYQRVSEATKYHAETRDPPPGSPSGNLPPCGNTLWLRVKRHAIHHLGTWFYVQKMCGRLLPEFLAHT